MKSKEKFSGQKTLRCILVTENKKSLGQVDFLACTFTFRDPLGLNPITARLWL